MIENKAEMAIPYPESLGALSTIESGQQSNYEVHAFSHFLKTCVLFREFLPEEDHEHVDVKGFEDESMPAYLDTLRDVALDLPNLGDSDQEMPQSMLLGSSHEKIHQMRKSSFDLTDCSFFLSLFHDGWI